VFPQHSRDRVHGHRVEPGERFVEYEQFRLVDERRCDLRALLVAERQGLHGVVGALGQSHPY
jgi:hypothetical protein